MANFKEKFRQSRFYTNFSKLETYKKIFWGVLLVCAVTLLVFSTVKLITTFKKPHNKVSKEYRNDPPEKITETVKDTVPENPIDFERLNKDNPDAVAWIYIPGSDEAYGTLIDYPIMQSSDDKDDNFYLNHGFDGKELFDGCIYIQKINNKNFEDPNTLIYGHDLYNHAMFTPLRKYRNKEFFDKHQNIYIYLPDRILKYKIFSASLFSDSHVLYSYNFHDTEEYGEYLKEITEGKKVLQRRDDVTVTPSDKIITLSTCTDREHERLLLSAVLENVTMTKTK